MAFNVGVTILELEMELMMELQIYETKAFNLMGVNATPSSISARVVNAYRHRKW